MQDVIVCRKISRRDCSHKIFCLRSILFAYKFYVFVHYVIQRFRTTIEQLQLYHEYDVITSMWQKFFRQKHSIGTAGVFVRLLIQAIGQDESALYLRKLAYIRNEDPYVLNMSNLCKLVARLQAHRCSVIPCSRRLRSYTIKQIHLSFQLCRYCHCTQSVLVTHNQLCNIGGSQEVQEVLKLQVLHQWVGTQWKEYCEEGTVVVLGKVRHCYAASKSPLKPWLIIRTNGTVKVAHCTCMVGLAETCSYVGVVLLCVFIMTPYVNLCITNGWCQLQSRTFLAYVSRTLTSCP